MRHERCDWQAVRWRTLPGPHTRLAVRLPDADICPLAARPAGFSCRGSPDRPVRGGDRGPVRTGTHPQAGAGSDALAALPGHDPRPARPPGRRSKGAAHRDIGDRRLLLPGGEAIGHRRRRAVDGPPGNRPGPRDHGQRGTHRPDGCANRRTRACRARTQAHPGALAASRGRPLPPCRMGSGQAPRGRRSRQRSVRWRPHCKQQGDDRPDYPHCGARDRHRQRPCVPVRRGADQWAGSLSRRRGAQPGDVRAWRRLRPRQAAAVSAPADGDRVLFRRAGRARQRHGQRRRSAGPGIGARRQCTPDRDRRRLQYRHAVSGPAHLHRQRFPRAGLALAQRRPPGKPRGARLVDHDHAGARRRLAGRLFTALQQERCLRPGPARRQLQLQPYCGGPTPATAVDAEHPPAAADPGGFAGQYRACGVRGVPLYAARHGQPAVADPRLHVQRAGRCGAVRVVHPPVRSRCRPGRAVDSARTPGHAGASRRGRCDRRARRGRHSGELPVPYRW